MLQIDEINDAEGFTSLEQGWNALLHKSAACTIFLTFEWLFTWWDIYKNTKYLSIITVRDNGNLIGVAPFYRSKHKYFALFNLHEISLLGSSEVGSDYLDIIIERGRENEVLLEIINYLKTKKRSWDCLNLDGISEESPNLAILKRISTKSNLLTFSRNASQCPYIKLPASWSEFLKSLSRKTRYDIRRKSKKLTNGHDVTFVTITRKEQVTQAIDDFIYLNQLRFKDKGISGAFGVPDFVEFHKRIISLLFDRGSVKLYFMKVNDAPIAGMYVFNFDNKCLYYQSGFDPQWGRYSPTTVLFSFCITHAIEQKLDEFDFLKGDESYKSHWAKNSRSTLEVTMYKKTFKNYIFFVAEKLKIRAAVIKRMFLRKDRN